MLLSLGNREAQPQLQQFIPRITLRNALADPVYFRGMYQGRYQLFEI